MLNTIYFWHRKFHDINPDTDALVPTGTEDRWITENWMHEKTGEGELNFWRAIDATVAVSADEHGVITFDNTSPDGSHRTIETFKPYDLSWAADTPEHIGLLKTLEDVRTLHVQEETAPPDVSASGDFEVHGFLYAGPRETEDDDETAIWFIDLDAKLWLAAHVSDLEGE